MESKVADVLRHTFGIKKGELFLTLIMQGYIFLLITILLIVKPTINALFIHKLGASNLPYAYILVAMMAVVISYFYNLLLKRLSLRTIISLTFGGFSLSFVGLSLALRWDMTNDFILYFYYLNVSIFGVLTTSQFWLFANLVFNAREAKRLFGFIGAGAIAGGIFGGYLTTFLSTLIGNENVIFLAAGLMMCCMPLLAIAWNKRVKRINYYEKSKITDKRVEVASTSSFSIILKSRHLTYLACIVGVGVLISKLVDYQFSDFAQREIHNVNALASFFGFWFSSFNVAALLIQLFLTPKILSRYGVTSSLLILPLAMAVGAFTFFVFPELWVLILLKGVDGTFKQSIHKSAIELSIMPIPQKKKKQAKSYIDVVIDSVATGLAGLLLYFFVRKLELGPEVITGVITLFLFIWLVLIFKLREAYFKSFVKNIQNSLLELDVDNYVKQKETTLSSAIRIFKTGTEAEIVMLLDRLSDYRLEPLKKYVIGLLNHDSDKVKIATIHQLYKYDRGTQVFKIEKLIKSQNKYLSMAAMEYLIAHTDVENERLLGQYLDHQDQYLSQTALVCLAKESRNTPEVGERYFLTERVASVLDTIMPGTPEADQDKAIAMLAVIGHARLIHFYDYILKQFSNKDPYVRRKAIEAAGLTMDSQFIDPLLNVLPEKRFRKKAIRALKRYGPRISEKLLKYLNDEKLQESIKAQVPKIIESFKTQTSVKLLFRLMKSKEMIVRRQSARSLTRLQRKKGKLTFDSGAVHKFVIIECENHTMLRQAFRFMIDELDKEKNSHKNETVSENDGLIAREILIEELNGLLEDSLKCIFDLLGLLYNQSDIKIAYIGLTSDLEEVKINGIELLDNLLSPKLKEAVLPVVEGSIMKWSNEPANHRIRFTDEVRCFETLVKSFGSTLLYSILLVIKNERNDRYDVIAKSLVDHKNAEISRQARNILVPETNLATVT